MRKKFTKMALVVAGVAAFSGMTAVGAQASDGPGKPGDGIPDATYKVKSFEQCKKWGDKLTDEESDKYAGYACWQGEKGQWYIDLML
ncbi:hypothetical protein ACTWQF_16035 [Streptomyces sp. 8N114]|uniref:hypothetical protein n=1 Tax=Streptomyces sp. 8N114 TaxID=3457419 RepID=UPI003FD5026C